MAKILIEYTLPENFKDIFNTLDELHPMLKYRVDTVIDALLSYPYKDACEMRLVEEITNIGVVAYRVRVRWNRESISASIIRNVAAVVDDFGIERDPEGARLFADFSHVE